MIGLAILLCASLLCACLPAGTWTLPPLGQPEAPVLMMVSGAAEIDHVPTRGLDLRVEVSVRNDGQTMPRVDLSRAEVRVDGVRWVTCEMDPQTDRQALITTLAAGATFQAALECRDVPQPRESVEVRFFVSDAGGRGVIVVPFGAPKTSETVES